MTWELAPLISGWRLVVDGFAVETLTWNAERSQYLNSQGIACGGNWPVAKSTCENAVVKPKKVGKS